MKITRIETIWLDDFPNICWVHVHTDTGLVGLGETFFGARAVSAYIHESVAPLLLGEDPLRIDWIADRLSPYVGYASSGVEMRGNSAIDIALWDLFGKVTGLPVYQLLGGRSRDRIRTYNTCAGPEYTRRQARQAVENWGVALDGPDPAPAPETETYEDLHGFLYHADNLARSLMAQGITGMKIWPFDPYAERSNGTFISERDLRTALEPFDKIRRAVGHDMDILVEFHGLWNLPAAKRIVAALEPYRCFWYEDPIRADSLDALADLAETTTVPLTISETLATRWGFRSAFDTGAVGVAMLDVTWCGGIGEAKKIATMAEAHRLPVAPHDCTGPVALMASTHLSLNAPNALIQESVRASYRGWYRDLVTHLPEVADGQITVSDRPGLGTGLRGDILQSDGATVEVSEFQLV